MSIILFFYVIYSIFLYYYKVNYSIILYNVIKNMYIFLMWTILTKINDGNVYKIKEIILKDLMLSFMLIIYIYSLKFMLIIYIYSLKFILYKVL